METELLFAKQTFCYGSHHFWVMSYGNRELSYQKTQSKQALSFCVVNHKNKNKNSNTHLLGNWGLLITFINHYHINLYAFVGAFSR